MKPFPWKCGSCHAKGVKPVVLASYSTELEHDGRKYTVTLDELEALQCGTCGEIVLDDAAEDRLVQALRVAAELMSPADIRGKREQLGLTQKQLAGALFIAESTLSRWETGAQIQQRTMDRFLRCFFEVPEVRRFLEAPESNWTTPPEPAFASLPSS